MQAVSIEAVGWALGVPVGGNAKVMLLGLANHAHPDGSNSFPSLDTLAVYGACDRSTARRNVRKLAEDGWIFEDGEGPRGTTKWQLAMPGVEGGGITPRGGSSSAAGGVAPVPPEPSKEKDGSSSSGTQEAIIEGVSPEMQTDAAELLKRKVKVGGRIVSEAEMGKAAAALAEFNRQAGSEFGLGAHLTPLVGRIRERPSYDAEALVRLVQSAWRLKWWERNGKTRRATPAVVFGNAACFENVVQDAVDEKAGHERPAQRGRFERTKGREDEL